MKTPTISFIIGTHNEDGHYISALLDQVLKYKDVEDEVIVVDDYSDNSDTLNTLDKYKDRVQIHNHALDNDFAAHKNFMNSLAKGSYIFNIDADEVPNRNLLVTLKEILINNPDVDLFSVPRVNIVAGLTEEYVQKWGWRLNDIGWVNFPDPQNRIYKNKPEIKWVNKVHEIITGTSTHTMLPAFDQEGNLITDYALFHAKTIDRQIKQNEFYEQL